MKLKAVRVRMFRNILDSTEVAIEDKVTCLVGKNESGKSAFLNALWRVKPTRSKPEFVIHDHYPAWLEKRHRNEGVNQKEFEPVEVGLEWEPADVKVMEERFGPGVVTAGTRPAAVEEIQQRLSLGERLQRTAGRQEFRRQEPATGG